MYQRTYQLLINEGKSTGSYSFKTAERVGKFIKKRLHGPTPALDHPYDVHRANRIAARLVKRSRKREYEDNIKGNPKIKRENARHKDLRDYFLTATQKHIKEALSRASKEYLEHERSARKLSKAANKEYDPKVRHRLEGWISHALTKSDQAKKFIPRKRNRARKAV